MILCVCVCVNFARSGVYISHIQFSSVPTGYISDTSAAHVVVAAIIDSLDVGDLGVMEQHMTKTWILVWIWYSLTLCP